MHSSEFKRKNRNIFPLSQTPKSLVSCPVSSKPLPCNAKKDNEQRPKKGCCHTLQNSVFKATQYQHVEETELLKSHLIWKQHLYHTIDIPLQSCNTVQYLVRQRNILKETDSQIGSKTSNLLLSSVKQGFDSIFLAKKKKKAFSFQNPYKGKLKCNFLSGQVFLLKWFSQFNPFSDLNLLSFMQEAGQTRFPNISTEKEDYFFSN